MGKFIRSIIGQVFPSASMRKANKQLKEKINCGESQSNRAFMDNFDQIPIESFRQRYAETFEVKNKFEDKAKTNVIGITIAITIIMGSSDLTDSLISKYSCITMHWISFIILLAAILYLLVSGIDAIKVLFNENTMSTKSKDTNMVDSSESSISYSETIIIPDSIGVTDVSNCIIQDREARNSIEDGTIYSFVNTNKNYYVQYKCFGSEIIVEKLFCFDKVIND